MLLDNIFAELFDDYMKDDSTYKKLSKKAAFSSCVCRDRFPEEYYKYIIDIENTNCFFTSHCISESLKYGFLAYVDYYKNGKFPDMLKDDYRNDDNSFMDGDCMSLEADYKRSVELCFNAIPQIYHPYILRLTEDLKVLAQHCIFLACKYGFFSCYQIFVDLHVL